MDRMEFTGNGMKILAIAMMSLTPACALGFIVWGMIVDPTARIVVPSMCALIGISVLGAWLLRRVE